MAGGQNLTSIIGGLSSLLTSLTASGSATPAGTTSLIGSIVGVLSAAQQMEKTVGLQLRQLMQFPPGSPARADIITKIETTVGVPPTVFPVLEDLKTEMDSAKILQLVDLINREIAAANSTSWFG